MVLLNPQNCGQIARLYRKLACHSIIEILT